jgi:predicted nucleotidyltransferase
MNVVVENKQTLMETVSGSILKVLAYFDIFQYPLKKDEIRKFIYPLVSDEKFDEILNCLDSGGFIFNMENFYSLHNDFLLTERRMDGNLRAEKLLQKAKRIGSFLHKFPYVRSVAVSGSLSKNFADKKADIDFFIITKANRVWIARTLLHFFKKFTFLTSRQHWYCMNYFIDEQALLIKEQNIYTAIEIVTLLPVSGMNELEKFFRINDWVDKLFPNYLRNQTHLKHQKKSILKRFFEWMFNKKMGDRFDDYLFRLTTKRWKNKETRGEKNKKGKMMNLVTGKNFAKSDPELFQQKIISLYDERVNELKNKWPQHFE